MNTMRNGNANLWATAMRALMAGAWVTARMAIDALVAEHIAQASDVFPSLDAIPQSKTLSAEYSRALSDRINAWNAAAARNAAA
jgi:hypothetical protein